MQKHNHANYYRADIDGLRSISVFLVVMSHAFGRFRSGRVGVDIFFVISGYLITGILLREMKNQSYSLLRFYERRFKRILPVLFISISVFMSFGL
jgi:peptidoglycan/LPS O-acetylase OafA/YrhL